MLGIIKSKHCLKDYKEDYIMIFEMIKNLFNKNENTEKIEYLGVDKVTGKDVKTTGYFLPVSVLPGKSV